MGGPGDEVSYSLGLLRDLGGDLARLVQAFEGRSSDVRYSLADVGHRDVVAALDHFKGNWDDKRETLVTSMTSLSDMALESATTFEGVDKELAIKIRDAVDCTP